MHDSERVNAVNILFYHVAEPVWYIIGQFSDHDLLKNPKEDFILCLQFGSYKHVFLDKSPSKFSKAVDFKLVNFFIYAFICLLQ